jgi:hypothetical protein
MYDELKAVFPGYSHFYEVVGLQLAEAMDRCARMTGSSANILQYQNKIIFALTHDLGEGPDFLNAIPNPNPETVEE